MAKIKNLLGAAGMAAIASLAMSTAALADDAGADAPKFGYSITLTGTSDYIFRGISFNDELPAFQPYFEFTYGIGYLGFWFSNIEGVGFNPMEMDIVAGIRPVTGPVSWDLGVLYYTYPANVNGWSATDYVEFKIGASITPIKNLTLGVTGYWTPDQANYTQTETVEGSASYALPKFAIFDPTISALIGYSTGDGTSVFGNDRSDYTYWNVGLKLAVDKYFMDFRYWDTDLSHADQAGFYGSGLDTVADARFVFSAGVTLP
jgi:uncharacterized protein (TIGR02001 family)